MKQYHEALQYILDNGTACSDRTGIGTISVFGYSMRFNLNEGFPAVTTKQLAWKAVVGELLWFLEGSTDERRLAEITYGKARNELKDKTTIWTANANAQGKALGYSNTDDIKELGPVYGSQWRNFDGTGYDQIRRLVNEIQSNPDSRRLILTAWNPTKTSTMALPPCHILAQFRVMNGKLSCHMYQRSADMFLGIPFNIASYSLLTHMVAKVCKLDVGDFIISLGDAHIYNTHIDVVREQLKRTPGVLPILELPQLTSLGVEDVKQLKVADFKLLNYNPMPALKAPMAV